MRTGRRRRRSRAFGDDETRSGTFDIDAFAKFLGVPTVEDIWELNTEWLGDAYAAGMEDARSEDLSEEEAEERALEWEQNAGDELFSRYVGALEAAAEAILGPQNLAAEAKPKKGIYKIVPSGTWREAASALVQTINGVGMFYYTDAKELKDAGPYKSYKQAVLSHLHWATRYPEVYGTRSAELVFSDSWR